MSALRRGLKPVTCGLGRGHCLSTVGDKFFKTVSLLVVKSVFLLFTGLPVPNCTSFVTNVFNTG